MTSLVSRSFAQVRNQQISFGIYGFAISFVAIAPLLPNHYPPWIGFHAEAAAFAGWLSLAAYISMVSSSPLRVPFSAIVPLFICIAVWLQYLCGQVLFAGDAITASTYLICASVAIVGGTNLAREDKTTNTLPHILGAIVFSASISSILAIVQWLRQEDLIGLFVSNMEKSGRPYGNLNQPNHLATYVLLGLVGSIYFYEKFAINRVLLGIFSLLSLTTLLMTESRSAVISLAALAGWALVVRRQIQMRIQLLSIVGWMGAFIVTWNSWSSICEFFLLQGSRETSFANSSGRLHMWKQILHGVLDSPWLGFGWHNTPGAQLAGSATVPSFHGQSLTDFSHNIFLDVIVWFGIPIGALASVVFLTWFVRRLNDFDLDLDRAFAAALCLPILVHSMFEFPFAYSYFLMPLCFFFGCMEKNLGPARHLVNRKHFGVALAALIAAMLYMFFEYLAAEEDYRIQRYETLRVGKRPEDYNYSRILVQTQLAGGLEAARFEPRKKMSKEEINRIQALTRRFLSAELQIKYIMALEFNGMPAEARLALAELTNTYGLQWEPRGLAALKDGAAAAGR
jgi:O-antigen ligase